MSKTVLVNIAPLSLDRATAPERLGPDAARICENVDLDWLAGRARRRAGIVKVKTSAFSHRVATAFAFVTGDGRKCLLTVDSAGALVLDEKIELLASIASADGGYDNDPWSENQLEDYALPFGPGI